MRDGYGMPMIPDVDSLPASFPIGRDPAPGSACRKICEVALRLRPEVLELRLLNERTVVDRELAQNQMLPGLNFYLYAEQNVGSPVPLAKQAAVHPGVVVSVRRTPPAQASAWANPGGRFAGCGRFSIKPDSRRIGSRLT